MKILPSSPPQTAIRLLEALEVFAYRVRPTQATLTRADGTTVSLTEQFCREHPYDIGVLTGLDFNDPHVRWRLQGLVYCQEFPSLSPHHFEPLPQVPWQLLAPVTDQEIWNDVIWDIIWQLQSGQLQAWGRKDSLCGERVEIPSDSWTAVHPQDVDWKRGSIPDKGLYAIVVDEVRVADAIPPQSAVSVRSLSKTYPKAEVREWYKQRISDLQSEGKTSSRDDDERAADIRFPGIQRDLLRLLRKELAPPSWSAPGPRKRS